MTANIGECVPKAKAMNSCFTALRFAFYNHNVYDYVLLKILRHFFLVKQFQKSLIASERSQYAVRKTVTTLVRKQFLRPTGALQLTVVFVIYYRASPIYLFT